MRILGLDVETTGLDSSKDRIIEMGCCLWDWDTHIPLAIYSALVMPERDIPEEITQLTGITNTHINEFGWPEENVILETSDLMRKADYVMAHNAPFDKGFFETAVKRQPGCIPVDKPWLDSRMDIVFPERVATRHLNYLAAEAGFINPWRHRAVFDVMTMLKLASAYDINAIISRSKEPIVYVQALVSFDEKELAKARQYQWAARPKVWYKALKESDAKAEIAACGFRTAILSGVPE